LYCIVLYYMNGAAERTRVRTSVSRDQSATKLYTSCNISLAVVEPSVGMTF